MHRRAVARKAQRHKKPETAIVKAQPPRPSWDLTTEEQVLVKNAICPGATDLEFQLCVTEAKHRRLDPIKKQIWFIPRWNSQAENADGSKGRKVWVPQVSIDGLRHIAARDHRDYGNEDEVEYGPMLDISWSYTYQGNLKQKTIKAPEWARVSIWKKGAARPTVAKVWWEEIYPDISNAPLVQRMPRLMLGKCASAQANRRAYPETGGLYIPEEFYGGKPEFTPDGRHLVYPEQPCPRFELGPEPTHLSVEKAERIDAQLKRYWEIAGKKEIPEDHLSRMERGETAESILKPSTTQAPAANVPETPKRDSQTSKPREYQGTVTLDWSKNEAEPIVRGDISNLTPMLEEHCHIVWKGDWWRMPPRYAETLRQMCEQLSFKLIEIPPKADTGGSAARPKAGAPILPPGQQTARGTEASSVPGTKDASLAVTELEMGKPGWVTGIIEQANPEAGKVPRVSVLFKIGKASFWMSTFDKVLFPALRAAKKKEATLIIERRAKGDKTYTNIIGFKRIGTTEYDDDGKTPVIQNKTREAGGKTLF